MAVDPDHQWQETDDVAELRRKIDCLREQVRAITGAWNGAIKDLVELQRRERVLWMLLRSAVTRCKVESTRAEIERCLDDR